MIKDDPIIRCMERTGFPPWMSLKWEDDEEDEDENSPWTGEVMAVYDP